MKKYFQFSILILALTLLSCEKSYNLEPNGDVAREIGKVVKSKLTQVGDVKFDLKKVTSFDWDKVYIVPPYTDIDKLGEKNGVDFSELGQTEISQKDGKNVLVFVKDKKVVVFSVIPRSKGDFETSDEVQSFTADKALFEVIKTKETFISGIPVMKIQNITK